MASTRIRVLITATLVLLAACGSAASTDSSASDVQGVAEHSDDLERHDGDGFSMLLPAGWTVLKPGDLDWELLLEGEDAAIADAVVATFDAGGKLFAFDFVNAVPTFGDNINIIALPRPPFSPSGVETMSARDLESVGATDIRTEVRDLPAGVGVFAWYRFPRFGSEGVQVTILTESTAWTITLSALDVGPLESMFTDLVESFVETG